jgi:hypothetical protein
MLTTYCNLALPTIVRVNGEIRIHEILGEKKGGDSHNLTSNTGERLSDLGALTAIFSDQDDNPIKPITSASSNLQ